MQLLLLNANDLRTALPMADAVECMKKAFAAFSAGSAEVPQRTHLDVPETSPPGVCLVMSAYVHGEGATNALGVKVVSSFPGNVRRGKPNVHGLFNLMDPETGEPLAVCDGTFLTAWRTGAASGAATDLLARKDVRYAAILGTGVQARTQAMAIDTVRSFSEIRVFSPNSTSVRSFVHDLRGVLRAEIRPAENTSEAVKGADVICTATAAPMPVLDGNEIAPGCHLNAVGSFRLDMRELDSATIEQARVFVDSRAAALEEAGELVHAMKEGVTDPEQWTEFGNVVSDPSLGRKDPSEITLFKSVGLAVQDVVAGAEAVRRAKKLGLGGVVEL